MDGSGRVVGESVSEPRPFKVGDLVRISYECVNIHVRGQLMWILELSDRNGRLFGHLEDGGLCVSVDPKHATLVDESETLVVAESVSKPHPFKVGDMVRIGDGHASPSARGKIIRISDIDPGGWLHGELPGHGRIGVNPKNATLLAIRLVFKYDPDNQSEFTEHATPVDWPSQPRSGRTTRMLLRAVHDALEGKSSRVVVSGSLDVCKMLRNRSEAIATPAFPHTNSAHTMAKNTTSTAFVLKFDGLSKRVHKEGEPEFIVPPAVIEFVPEPIAAGLESPPADWNHWNDNGEDRS